MTPTKESPILTFKELIKVPILAGMTILVRSPRFVQLNVFAILMSSLSVLLNPLKISKIVTTREIAIAITMIAGVPAPTHKMIIGPKGYFRQTV